MRRKNENGVAATLAALLTVALAVGCGGDVSPDPVRAAPAPENARLSLAAQAADTFTVVATWSPVVVEGDTIREYVREAGWDDGSWEIQDTIQAVGSETVAVPAPAEGETITGFYCLRSVRRAGDGSAVVAPQDSADFRKCAGWQYTAPLSFPPPPDSLEATPQAALAIDSIVVYPKVMQFRAAALADEHPWPDTGFTVERGAMLVQVLHDPTGWEDSTWEIREGWVQQGGQTVYRVYTAQGPNGSHPTAAIYEDGVITGCDGQCDTVTVNAAGWRDGVPFYLVGRPGYPVGEEWMVSRLPWFRQLS